MNTILRPHCSPTLLATMNTGFHHPTQLHVAFYTIDTTQRRKMLKKSITQRSCNVHTVNEWVSECFWCPIPSNFTAHICLWKQRGRQALSLRRPNSCSQQLSTSHDIHVCQRGTQSDILITSIHLSIVIVKNREFQMLGPGVYCKFA